MTNALIISQHKSDFTVSTEWSNHIQTVATIDLPKRADLSVLGSDLANQKAVVFIVILEGLYFRRSL